MIQTSGQFKNKIVLDQKSKAIFLWEFFIYIKKDISYTKNNFKRLKIENEANEWKKVRECLT